jgi:alkanesulfonate monooxygenase SsuD/methylene tetrahydromethanopterin reductase-like flavin-dependent oxidoreductase (luciferase family)
VKIGIGLPNPVPNTEGHVLLDWAKRAEEAGFSGLVTIDRIAYPSYDSLTALSAAAGATERISLMTNILPTHDERVPILVGGNSDKTIERVLKWGDGWTAGGAPAAQSAPYATKVRDAWSGAGRSGEPRIASLAYFSLGEDAEEASREYLLHYYGFLGDYGPMIANGALRSVSQVTDAVKAFEDAGFTELYFDPTVAKLDQIDRLADAVL